MDLINLLSVIDSAADGIVRDVAGNRTEEYRTAETQAQAFKDAGDAGEAGEYVASWASAKGWSATQAAEDILTTAALWRQAQGAIRAQRLMLKERARSGADAGEVLGAWQAFERAIRTQLGVPTESN